MRTLVFLLAVSVAAAQAADRQRYVMPTQKRVGVYANRLRTLNEQALFTAGTDDRLIVLANEGRYLKVKNTRGRTGWVEKRLVTTIDVSARMMFGDETVLGYPDNPTPLYVGGIDDPGEAPLRLGRSFREELAINVDRETIERSTP